RPVIRLGGAWHLALEPEARLGMNGLVVAGAAIEVATTAPAGGPQDHDVTLDHCTLVPGLSLGAGGDPGAPGAASLTVAAPSEGRLTVTLRHCIAGRIDITGAAPGYEGILVASDGIVDATGGSDPAIAARDVTLQRVTVLGRVAAITVPLASDAILRDPMVVERTQV